MRVSRRNIFAQLLAGIAGFAVRPAAAATPPAKVAYHLADLDKVNFVLGNIENHIAGERGNVSIVLVVHGPALAMFQTARTNADITRRTAGIAKAGVNLAACGNTMDAQKISVMDLLPGFVRVEEGGVVRLARLQAEGYAYLRP